MKIAVDVRELQEQPTGAGRVIEGLLAAWPASDELLLFSRRALRLPAITAAHSLRIVAGRPVLPGVAWEQLTLPRVVRAAGCEALLAPGYGMPRRPPCPTVVFMHDCAPFALPATFGWRERARRRWSARVAAKRSVALVMGSRFAADEARRHLGVSDERLLVVPYGLPPGFKAPSTDSAQRVRRQHGLADTGILFVGSGLQRRGIDRLIELSSQVIARHPAAELWLVGSDPEGVGVASVPGHVRRLGYVPDDQLTALYGAATVLAYPSVYEGFGLPVMEALACGTPVVASATSALHEIYDGRADLVEHGDDDAWIAALDARLRSSQPLAAPTRQWAASQTWTAAAHAIRDRLEQATGGQALSAPSRSLRRNAR